MGAKVLLKGHKAAVDITKAAQRCYHVSESGEEICVTKEMIKGACKQLLSRCKNK